MTLSSLPSHVLRRAQEWAMEPSLVQLVACYSDNVLGVVSGGIQGEQMSGKVGASAGVFAGV